MKVVIWGSRGSLPASVNYKTIEEKIFKSLQIAQKYNLKTDEQISFFMENHLPFSIRGSYGTNTSCVEVRDMGLRDFIVFDAGTGLRDFGNYVMSLDNTENLRFHIFISHLHWDHIQGFPFFVPGYIQSNQIHFYGFHPELEKAFTGQQNEPYFPVSMDYMNAEKQFHTLDLDQEYDICGFRLKGIEQSHPGESYGYSLEKNGKKIVYSTDSENKEDSYGEGYPLLQFYKNADLLIMDTQYSLMDAIYSKRDWGHSSNIKGVDLSIRANVKHLCMFHSEPTYSDETLHEILEETRQFAKIYAHFQSLNISLAYDGLEIEV